MCGNEIESWRDAILLPENGSVSSLLLFAVCLHSRMTDVVLFFLDSSFLEFFVTYKTSQLAQRSHGVGEVSLKASAVCKTDVAVCKALADQMPS